MSVETLIRWEVRLGRLHWAVKLAATLAIVVVVSTVRWVLREWLTLLPFLPYFPVVVVCAVLFGRRYAYGASTIGFFIALYYFVPPEFSFDVGAEAWGSSLLFLLVLVFTGWSVGTLKHFADRLYAAERAKAAPLDELNHRIKNNLQMVSSLLIMEAARLSDPHARRAFDDAISRIAVIGQMHTMLYQQDAAETVDAREFLERLCVGLHASFVGDRPIAIWSRAPALALGLDRAVPIGLIVNEAVTNALRHGFPDTRGGTVEVRLEAEGGQVVLRICDDGSGIDPTRPKGLGTRLIEMMAGQLGGTAKVAARPGGGTEVMVTVPG